MVLTDWPKLTPCLLACSLRARTQALCQCSLKDLKENREDRRLLTPASVSLPPPPRENLNLRRDPHTPPVRVWCVRLSGSCQWVSDLAWVLVPDLLGRRMAREYCTSQVSTTSREARNNATRSSQLQSWPSINPGLMGVSVSSLTAKGPPSWTGSWDKKLEKKVVHMSVEKKEVQMKVSKCVQHVQHVIS